MNKHEYNQFLIDVGFKLDNYIAGDDKYSHGHALFLNSLNIIEGNEAELITNYFIQGNKILILREKPFEIPLNSCCHSLFDGSIKSIQITKHLFSINQPVNIQVKPNPVIKTSLFYSAIYEFREIQDFKTKDFSYFLTIQNDYIKLNSTMTKPNLNEVKVNTDIFFGEYFVLTEEEFKAVIRAILHTKRI